MPCHSCGGTEIEYDASQGNTFCVQCGVVLEENTIVSEVQFGESAAGTAVLQGQFVSAEKGRSQAPQYGTRFDAAASKDYSLAQARTAIRNLAVAVNMTEHHAELAFRWYQLAIQHSFTKGRRAANVYAACLYIVSRQEKTPHMLLDFSDVLRTNVFNVGNTYLRLVPLLNQQDKMPLIDPCLFVPRFAEKLKLGAQSRAIMNTALRLVKRMDRDWIVTGRRPSGICGACLLIAARMHKVERSFSQMIRVVKVCEATLKKRIVEFRRTPTGQLTVDDFQSLWLEQAADPPAFARLKRAEPAKRRRVGRPSNIMPTPGDHQIEENEEDLENEMKAALRQIELTPELTAQVPEQEPLEESLSDVESDDEMRMLVLDPKEQALKAKVWEELHGEYVKEMAQRRELREASQKTRKKRKRSEKKSGPPDAQDTPRTPAEATMGLVRAKKLSKKINYAALDGLFEAA